MHKRAFQALQRTFMHVSGLPPPYFDKKTNLYFRRAFQALKRTLVFYQNMVGERPETCINVRFRPETHVYACLRSSPTIF